MSYKVEELLALRGSVSESAVSLDRFADEDVIKEHVLRPCVSANSVAVSLEKPFQATSVPAIVPGASTENPSPSPSIKRGKAERLLKEHGSPPGMRVTAGGRVVPSDLPPLASARFGNNNFKPPALRSVASGNMMSAQAQSDINNAPRVEVFGNQPVIWVGDRMYALPAYNAAPTMPSLAQPVVDAAKQVREPMMPIQGAYSSGGGVPAPPQRSSTQTPFTNLDLQALKQQQTFKKQELRTVEQTEVLQASHQNDAWRTSMIEKKRSLIVELDLLRRQIIAAEATEAAEAVAAPPKFIPQLQQPISQSIPQVQPIPQALYPMLASGPFPPLMMYPPPFGAYQGTEVPQLNRNGQFLVSSEVTVPSQSPNSASRRSHAIEIKPPRDEPKKRFASALDPKSPTYEPVMKLDTEKAPPTPSPAKHSPWCSSREILSQKASLSSIDTTDFFPTNTHEHSSTRLAPQVRNTNIAVPSTPEKSWPASPWNHRSDGNSSSRSAVAMPSWPDTLPRQITVSSVGHTMSNQTAGQHQERNLLSTTEAMTSTLADSGENSQQRSNRQTGIDGDWFIASSPVSHAPLTYQEGYQAGYDHTGLPDSLEVLQGFIQGMLQSIEDGKKGCIINHSTRNIPLATVTAARSASLRSLLASTAHDSAVGMSFPLSSSTNVAQENVRSAKANPILPGPRQDPVYSPQGQRNVSEAPTSYTLRNEAVRESRPRNPSSAMYPGAGIPEKNGSGYRHVAMPDNVLDKQHQGKCVLPRTDSSLSSTSYPRHFSGNQLSSQFGNRGYGTPIPNPMQRYYPVPSEYVSGAHSTGIASFARPAPDQRLSGLDGAMDELVGVVLNTHIDEQARAVPAESVVTEASCSKASFTSKGKQKTTHSPPMLASKNGKEPAVSSLVNPAVSPRKTGEHSPAKAKLEQVTNKFRRIRKDDPRNMSPEEKREHSKKWRTRFQKIKTDELKNMSDYARDNPRKTNEGSANQRM